mmetsp:Transcript_5237/g.7563  ORF Transcript_5237/g.7563 Transcript_5237/m.7563 type:complete len:176 (+) Transcript_5237:80-607(+)|eukprot:CAMPEP_0194247964 /NCGR_PEP_ID=MMETSP0158-20130606/17318_1 /TAXON_ID=33649 /ORGANISM="Thalassionema nitzschioides, Strain L26-B" /LENGTH=175 /DNA_ID=CAMNT_0038984123 /DNA_START=17 /DNA_END=544 /DNA_ORIENTATION=+
MLKRVFICYFFLLIAFLPFQFTNAEVIEIEEDHPLFTDPDLLGAMEIFMRMSPEERESTIQGLMEAVGDDPEKRKEMELIISKLPAVEQEQLKKNGGSSSLNDMIQEDEFAKAKHEAKKQLNGIDWESFWAMQEEVLESVIAAGQVSPEDAAHFKTDEEAWKKQLRTIWEDLQQE